MKRISTGKRFLSTLTALAVTFSNVGMGVAVTFAAPTFSAPPLAVIHSADWCGPCNQALPVDAAGNFSPRVQNLLDSGKLTIVKETGGQDVIHGNQNLPQNVLKNDGSKYPNVREWNPETGNFGKAIEGGDKIGSNFLSRLESTPYEGNREEEKSKECLVVPPGLSERYGAWDKSSDLPTLKDSPTNKAIKEAYQANGQKPTTLEGNASKLVDSIKDDQNTGSVKTMYPSQSDADSWAKQAKEKGGGTKNVNGIDVHYGRYTTGKTYTNAEGQKFKVTDDCEFVKDEEGPGNNDPSNPGGNQQDPGLHGGGNQGNPGGGGGGGNPGGGGLGQLAQLLGPLLGSLLGGRGGNQQPTPTPFSDPNNLGACPTNYQPVCGSDGTTYTNQCYATRLNVPIVSNTACGQGGNTIGTLNLDGLAQQVAASGIPEPLISQVARVVSTLISQILSGALSVSETVIH